MGPRITIVGGGSYQWIPTLVADMANTPSLHDARLVLEDLDPRRLEMTGRYVAHVARVRGIGMSVETTTDLPRALDGADFVVVCISTGGLDSMRVDLEVAAKHGIVMPGGDTVGPSGINRALRNIPVVLGIASTMERWCPDAWLLNVTNPLTALSRAVTRETTINTVGLCHEVLDTTFWLSQLLDVDMRSIDPVVAGVNHLPVIIEIGAGGDDGMAGLRDLLEGRADTSAPLPLMDKIMGMDLVGPGGDLRHPGGGGRWTKQTILDMNQLNLELLLRFGALPGANQHHTAEFFANFCTETSAWGKRWGGLDLTTIEDREARERRYLADLERRLTVDEVPPFRSQEMVAPVIDSLLGTRTRHLPLNIPNHGHCPDLPAGAVVEAMCTVDGNGIRGRDVARLPPFFAEHVRRVSASQELTVDAALSGDGDTVLAALLTDPMASRCDYDVVTAMRDDLLEGTSRWLPQFVTRG